MLIIYAVTQQPVRITRLATAGACTSGISVIIESVSLPYPEPQFFFVTMNGHASGTPSETGALTGTMRVKAGLAQMLKGGVIMGE